MDIETDPFKTQEVPVPFVVGLYNGKEFYKFWNLPGRTCIEQARDFLDGIPAEERGIIYMHNGGRFDFFYMLDWFEGRTMIMNSRIIKAVMKVQGYKNATRSRDRNYVWEFRDSFAIMPFALKVYKKDDIDIWKLGRKFRKKYASEIELYLRGDCVYLWELCMEFQREFGDYLTIASAAFKQLTNRHSFTTLPESQDHELRQLFFYGGRVECFAKGVIEGDVKIYDVNSMYPFVMGNFLHPTSYCVFEGGIGSEVLWDGQGCKRGKLQTFFITVEGENNGAFPVRAKDGSIDFSVKEGTFHVSIHEWNAAKALGLFKPQRVLATYNFSNAACFDTFVKDFYTARKKAKESGDAILTIFYKYILNSAYGKFAINPENFYSWQLTQTDVPPPCHKNESWELDSFREGSYYVWKSKNHVWSWNYKNVATGASITGAARSVLLRAIAQSKGVLYCDTDSILCREFSGGDIHDTRLGAWKCEASGDKVAIAGKKMYAVFNGQECIKQATKGVVLTAEEIVKVAQGENVLSIRDAPTFQRDGTAKFVNRNVRMT